MDFTSEQREQRVTEKVGLLKGAETSGYSDKAIPSWGDLQDLYESRWVKEKTKFQILCHKLCFHLNQCRNCNL